MWVRGLKLVVSIHGTLDVFVAPYVGAWIETQLQGTPRGP